MSLRAIPLLAIAWILYNLIALTMGVGAPGTGDVAGTGLWSPIFSAHLLSGGTWTFTWGDLILFVTLILLFIELLKSTFTSTSTLIDHALSMLLTGAMLVQFLMTPQAATSVFFLLLVAGIIDVIAGYTIGIRVARRDLSIGGPDA